MLNGTKEITDNCFDKDLPESSHHNNSYQDRSLKDYLVHCLDQHLQIFYRARGATLCLIKYIDAEYVCSSFTSERTHIILKLH